MVDHNEHTPEDSTPSEGEPRPSDAGPDVSSHTDGHDDASGLGGYIGRVGARAGTLARAIISRSAAAGNRVRRPIGTTLATLGGMLQGVTGRDAGGIGLFRGTINSSDDAVDSPTRAVGREPSKLVWLQPVSPATDSTGPVSRRVDSEVIKRRPEKPRDGSSAGDSEVSRNSVRQKTARNGKPIGRAAATRIRRRPETRSLRDVPTYVESPATMQKERLISGKLSQPFVSKSKWAPTEYESTKDRPPASLANFLERNVDAPKEHRLRPVSVSRHGDSRPETPLRRAAANHTNTNSSGEEGRTKDAPKPTSLNQVSVIHRDLAEAPVPSEKNSESRDRRPRIYDRSKRMISKGRDAILRKQKVSNSTTGIGAGQSVAVNIESPNGTTETGSRNASSEKISRSPLSEPQVERKNRATGPIQRDPIPLPASTSDARNAETPLREQPSSSVGAGNSGPAPGKTGFSPSSTVDVTPVQGKAKGIVNRARKLVFRKPSNEMSAASDFVESTLLADAVQRRPDSKTASDFERPAKARTVLTRAREKLVRKPKTSKPKASTADQQVPQEAVRPPEIVNKPTEVAGEKSAPPVRRMADTRSTMPSSMSGSPTGEQSISSDKVEGTQAGLLSQPMMEHRADRYEPGHTAVPAEPSSMAKPVDSQERLRRSSKDTGADENAPGDKRSARVERPKVPARSLGEVFHKSQEPSPTEQDRRPGDGGRSLISQVAQGINLGAQRLIFRSAPSISAETLALAGGQAKASPPKKRAMPSEAGQRETDVPRETLSASVLQRAEGAASTRKGIVHRRQADNAPTDGIVDRAIAARPQTRPIGSTKEDALSSTTGAISNFQALKSIVSRKAAIEPGSSVSAGEPADPRPPTSAKERNNVRSAPELLHRKTADSPGKSPEQADTLGKAILRSPLVRASERPAVHSGVIPPVPHKNIEGESGRSKSRSRRALSQAPQVQRRTHPASTNAPLQHATADTPMLISKIGRSPNGSGPDETLTESETGRNEAAAKGLGRKLEALVHKRESHGMVREDAPHVGPARPSKASRAADTNAPVVQRASTAKEPVSFLGRAVHRTQMVGISATTQNGTISRDLERPTQAAGVEPGEPEEPLYKKFTPKDIEFLSSKMFTYIKRRLSDDRERHGRPGFSMWS